MVAAANRNQIGLEWLDNRDPARELVARLRLVGAMRNARAALAARDTTRTGQRELVGRDEDGGRS